MSTSGSSGDPGGTSGSSGDPRGTSGSSGDPGGSGDAEGAQGDASTDATSDASCELLASSLDTSCTSDSDCVFVPPGGDTCNPCMSAQTFWCTTSVANATSAAAYLARIEAVQNQMRAVNSSGGFCAASCPELGTPQCVNGQCG